MILILSQSKFEPTTDRVIDWLAYYNAGYFRINGDDIYSKDAELSVNFGASVTSIKCKKFFDLNYSTFKVGWYRRWSLQEYNDGIVKSVSDVGNAIAISKYLSTDDMSLKHFFLSFLTVKYWVTNPFKYNYPKSIILKEALGAGLLIPQTLITTSKKELTLFCEKHGEIISKDLSNGYYIIAPDLERLYSQTKLLNKNDIDSLPSNFLPATFQKKIEKEYEIRTFFLNNECFSMAIFSQNDPKTQIDFRNYNHDNPNRQVPYKLPKDIEKKLTVLMNKLQLNNGSIDIIKSLQGDYIFLEVNPVGQFGMTSYPCNYQLEKKMAEYLITLNKKQ